MSPRATAMSADLRREALVDATLPLLLEHGRAVTTRQIATAAGVAEGTIFRVFDSKEALLDAAVVRGLDPTPFLEELQRIDPDQDLRGRLLDLVTHLQIRFRGIFTLMTAMGIIGPPGNHERMETVRRRSEEIVLALIEPDADAITCRPDQLAQLLRLLAFSGTHPHIRSGTELTPDQIVGVVLDGVLRKES